MSKQSSSSDEGSLNIAFFSVLIVSLTLLFLFHEGEAIPKEGEREIAVLSSLDEDIQKDRRNDADTLYNDNFLIVQSAPSHHKPQTLATKAEEEKATQRRWVRLSAYAPTDPNAIEGMCFSGDPTITASGSISRKGVVAANFLSFGTKIKIPSVFGERVFTVEDRMSSRYTNTVDILVSSKQEAINFGNKMAYIEILND